MPELPEVETVRIGIAPCLLGRVLESVEVRRRDLRWPVPENFAASLTGRTAGNIARRGKYLLIATDGPALLLHLGMSGSIRIGDGGAAQKLEKHDHILFRTDAGTTLAFNDPRRFGAALLLEAGREHEHPLLSGLGPEPLSKAFNGETLRAALKGRTAPIKAALLDQATVAGLGNIYVCEALFMAGIAPDRPAGTLGEEETVRLAAAIRDVLEAAIHAGGSSLKDHIRVNGAPGYFQHSFKVYDRADHPCPRPGCSGILTRLVQSGRSTYFCPRCQH